MKVLLLASKGGSDLKDITRRIMSTLLTNKMMTKLNWTGQGKGAFNTLELVKVISSELTKKFLWQYCRTCMDEIVIVNYFYVNCHLGYCSTFSKFFVCSLVA